MLRARRLVRRTTSAVWHRVTAVQSAFAQAVVVLRSFTRTRTACSALALLLWTIDGDASSLFDSIYRFRVLPTDHFMIYFHQGEDRLAARLASIAEETWHTLQRPLGTKPPSLTHVVLVDQTELANGYAMPLPRDTIVITATRSEEHTSELQS